MHRRMIRARRWLRDALPLLALAAVSCGRTQSYFGDGGVSAPDWGTKDQTPADFPWPDMRAPDRWPPPPLDLGPPPPPPPDFGPWPDYPPPPPPDYGPWPDYAPPPPPDYGPWPDYAPPPPDYGPWPDAAPPDYGLPDAQPVDAGWPDAGWPDFTVPDASWADGGPTRPDLVFGGFKAAVVADEVRYEVLVCNQGDADAPGFFVDLYYDRPGPPAPGEYGDDYWDFPSLAVGACASASFRRLQTPAGKYLSWAQLDADLLVDEHIEQNNVAGPLAVAVALPPPPPPPPPPVDGGPPPPVDGGPPPPPDGGPPPLGCVAVCAFALQCGVFGPDGVLQCGTWCNGLTVSQLQCLQSAIVQGSCQAFQACQTPPPPPPPPPPGVCASLCDFFIDTCQLLPAAQYWTCVGICQLQPPDALACAEKERLQGRCMAAVNCWF